MYREYIIQKLEKDPLLRKELASLRGQVLGCYCKPQACHGDVLVELMHSEHRQCAKSRRRAYALGAEATATETKAHNFISKHKLKGFD